MGWVILLGYSSTTRVGLGRIPFGWGLTILRSICVYLSKNTDLSPLNRTSKKFYAASAPNLLFVYSTTLKHTHKGCQRHNTIIIVTLFCCFSWTPRAFQRMFNIRVKSTAVQPAKVVIRNALTIPQPQSNLSNRVTASTDTLISAATPGFLFLTEVSHTDCPQIMIEWPTRSSLCFINKFLLFLLLAVWLQNASFYKYNSHTFYSVLVY